MDILMLDLEGVLIYAASAFIRPLPHKLNAKRNFAQEFVDECRLLFDKIYMNTLVSERWTKEIMENHFNLFDFEYWPARSNKTENYESLIGHTVIHVEDGINDEQEAEIKRLGFHYIPVRSLVDYLKGAKYDPADDMELKNALEEIKKILRNI